MKMHNWVQCLRALKPMAAKRRRDRERNSIRKRSGLGRIELLEKRALLAGLLFGETVNETIGTAGDQDRFELSLATPAKIYVDSLKNFSDVR
ncbi:MAG: hypothetical protein SGI77_26060 [Pirellulaceae bacterium]|nr:hypothetical protein [Pirellulaceae bacterium]